MGVAREGDRLSDAQPARPLQRREPDARRAQDADVALHAGVVAHDPRGHVETRVRERGRAHAVDHVARRHELAVPDVEGRAGPILRRDQDRAGHDLLRRVREVAGRVVAAAGRRGRWRRRGRGGARHGHAHGDVAVAEGSRAAAAGHVERDGAERAPRAVARARADVEAELGAHALPDAHLDDGGGRARAGHGHGDVAVAVGAGAAEAAHVDGDGAERAPAAALGPRADVERVGVGDALPDAHLDVGGRARLRARARQQGEPEHRGQDDGDETAARRTLHESPLVTGTRAYSGQVHQYPAGRQGGRGRPVQLSAPGLDLTCGESRRMFAESARARKRGRLARGAPFTRRPSNAAGRKRAWSSRRTA